MKQKRANEAIGVLLLLVGLFAFVSLLFFHPSDYAFYTSHPNEAYRNITGQIGVFVAHYLILAFGWSSFSIPAIFLFWASCFFLQKVPQKKLVELTGIAISIVAVASLFSLTWTAEWKMKAGGVLGFFIARNLETYFGVIGGVIISLCCLALALLVATDFLLYPLFERVFGWAKRVARRLPIPRLSDFKFDLPKPKQTLKSAGAQNLIETFIPPKVRKYAGAERAAERLDAKAEALKKSEQSQAKSKAEEIAFDQIVPRIKVKKIKEAVPEPKEPSSPPAQSAQSISARPDEQIPLIKYNLPPLDLLQLAKRGAMMKEEELHQNSKILEETLRDFGVQVKVVEVEQGPVITRYELLPAPGVKVNRIVSLSDDLALALKTTSVRFLTPIPGKNTMGIEIPNTSTTMVWLRELLESPAFQKKEFTIPLMLGKDTSGKPLIADLQEMPHLLIAGATGSGKTVCLNSVISGILCAKSPEELRFIMVDPKMVELAIYRDLPHMMTPVVTDVRKAATTLNWLVSEMERRYRIFAAVGTRNIKAFNARKIEGAGEEVEGKILPQKLPFIVLVIDELADLMLVSRDKVEIAITRLAQLSRAVGIHLILATQRPSVDVITGVIKANFPARISFKVSSKVDSRTVLDANGADKLIGKGDMLFLEPGEAKPVRGQGTFISDEEILAVVKFIKKTAASKISTGNRSSF